MRPKFLLVPALGLFLIQPVIRDAGSCSVPVFRYALERWKPDPYKGIFIYRGELKERDRVLLQQLEKAALDSELPLNLRIREVNTETFPEEKLKELLKGPVPLKLPVLAIWYPEQMGEKAPLWVLELTPAIAKALSGSPRREQLAESLINGDSIVWVFVPSGNSAKDAQAKALIQKELELALNTVSKMPFFIQQGSKQKRLTYGFPILAISRTDPEERFFLDMLLSSESDLHEYKGEPMVFPVFGRGRLLGCLFGEYITEEKIQGVIAYLAGSCSCEVKAQNPGMDLLIPALWDRVVMGELYSDDSEALPELTGVMPGKSGLSETKALKPAPAKKHTSFFTVYGITLGAAVVVVVFAGLILSHRRREK